MSERSTSPAGRPTRLGPTRSTWARERPRRTTCRWATRCGCGSRRRRSWGGSPIRAGSGPEPTPRPRARDRSSPCASSGLRPRYFPRTPCPGCRCRVASTRPTGRGWAYGLSSRRSGSSAGTRTWTRSGPGSSGWREESSSRSRPYRGYTTKLKSSIDLQTQALLVLAVLGGLAVLVLVGQALARQAALESSEHPLLLSLGMTHRQLFALGMMRVAPVSLAAGALAFGTAVALSPLAPIGVARWAEPDPGLALDAPLVGGGAVATTALVLLAALVPAWRASRTTAAGRSAAVIGRRRIPGTSGLPGKRRVWCPHGARARPRPDRRARALDTARRHRRRRRGIRRVHDHREQGSPARHAEVVRPEPGRS